MKLRRAAGLAAGFLALAILEPAPAHAQARDVAFATTTLDLAAGGEAKAAPDMASLTVSAQSTASTAREAMRANAQKMTAVIAALERAGVASRDLQTSSLSLEPQYAAEDQGRPARLTGYQASNEVTVTVRDLASLGPVVDAAAGAGAANIGQIGFGLANPVSAQNTARIAAVKALQDKAALYAQAVGYHIVRLVNLSEGGGYGTGPPRPMGMATMRMAAAPTPVEPGEMTVRIDITGVFELAR
jgi:uncharacterized protein YggE